MYNVEFYLLDAAEQFNIYFFVLFNNFFFTIFLVGVLIVSILLLNIINFYFGVVVNAAVDFIRGTIKNNVNDKVFVFYMPFYLILFFIIVMANICGLIPFAFTAPALLILPFFFSFINFVFTSWLMIEKWGFFFFAGFLPSGTNIFIAPLLTIIEIVSHFVKLISLAVRLFANLFAGHVLIKVLISLIIVLILSKSILFFILSWFLFALVFAILGLEIFICFLQAYVFINLGSIYLNQAVVALEH